MTTTRALADALRVVRRAQTESGRWVWADVDDASVSVLVEAYQDRHRRRGGEPARLTAEAIEVLAHVLIERIWQHVRVKVTERRGEAWLLEREEDLRGETQIWAFDQLGKYRAREGADPFSYLVAQAAWFISDALRAETAGGRLDRADYQVHAAMLNVAERLREDLGREPHLEELRDATRQHLLDQRIAQLAAERPDLSDRELLDEAVAGLRRSGQRRALDDLSRLRMMGDDLSLDAPVGTDPGYTLGSTIEAPEAGDGDRTLERLYAVALGDQQWARPVLAARFGAQDDVEGEGALDWERPDGKKRASVPRLADATGLDRPELRSLIDAAVNRMGAPHAQWSYLGGVTIREAQTAGIDGYSTDAFADA